ncbi:unnamed protein product [Ectocarpus sp. 4 AP-2014]
MLSAPPAVSSEATGGVIVGADVASTLGHPCAVDLCLQFASASCCSGGDKRFFCAYSRTPTSKSTSVFVLDGWMGQENDKVCFRGYSGEVGDNFERGWDRGRHSRDARSVPMTRDPTHD